MNYEMHYDVAAPGENRPVQHTGHADNLRAAIGWLDRQRAQHGPAVHESVWAFGKELDIRSCRDILRGGGL